MFRDFANIGYECPTCGSQLVAKDATKSAARPNLRWWHVPSQIQISACPHCGAALELKGVGFMLFYVVAYGVFLGLIDAFVVPDGFPELLFKLVGLASCVVLALLLRRQIRYVKA